MSETENNLFPAAQSSQEEPAGKKKSKKRRKPGENRDSEAARNAAEEMVKRAQASSEAIGEFHQASDVIEKADAEILEANERRVAAVKKMRDNKTSIVDIENLTGLSSSRIQSMIRTGR
ncbi:MAG: hypothetical protein P8N13_09500 [Ilumatobacter sp.]|nr:hypothetical protein [Ilumatobacter sp.]